MLPEMSNSKRLRAIPYRKLHIENVSRGSGNQRWKYSKISHNYLAACRQTRNQKKDKREI